jgi:phosphatidylserine/phosphatidylglycerophosphate/cardiolipin synthase-like enzyme
LPETVADQPDPGGKVDGYLEERDYGVFLTEPWCDVCSFEDKAILREVSPIIQRVVTLIDGARSEVAASQFTFSVREIEEALLRAQARGVEVRLAIDAGQDRDGSLSRRLLEAGLDVRFVVGRPDDGRGYNGLLHAKFMLVDDSTLLIGSNNWSSTGTTINEENTIVLASVPEDPILEAHRCYFERIWSGRFSGAADCSVDEVAFSPSSGPYRMIRDEIRVAETSVDVLMHHLNYPRLVRELTRAAERGVRVRVIANLGDREDYTGSDWDDLLAAGGDLRFKQNNPDAYQLMHHKLVIVDGSVLINGTGNWSGSAFFNNFESTVRYDDFPVVGPFVALFDRLWLWSLSPDSVDADLSAARQHAAETTIYFGNLHAHFFAESGGRMLDDGRLSIQDQSGTFVPVDDPSAWAEPARYALEYARDSGGLDFLALTPHVSNDVEGESPNNPNMNAEGYERILQVTSDLTAESQGTFVAIPGMEWSSNSTGNHMAIFGTTALAKIERGRFDLLYEDFLPDRVTVGDRPLLQLCHPRTFQRYPETLTGSWDQIYDVMIPELPSSSQRRRVFNDYGLDDYEPLRSRRDGWIAGEELPDLQTVLETLTNIEAAARPYIRLMEVTLARGNEIGHEAHQNPSFIPDADGELYRRTRVHADWEYYLLNGFRIAPTANHDNHYANWGTGHSSRTAAISHELTEASILDAIDDRLVYASEDENLEVRLYADGRILMGGTLGTGADQARIDLFVVDPDYSGFFEVRLFMGTVGGEVVNQVAALQVEGGVWDAVDVQLPGPGRHFVYLEVLEVDVDRMAWTAPIWIEVR